MPKSTDSFNLPAPRGGSSNAESGPRFSDYGLRRATNDLTKEEIKAEHNWRMKNDLDYKNQVAREKAAKGTQPNHHTTSVDRKTGKAN